LDPNPETFVFTATTEGGDVVEFVLPLHPQTSSQDHVGMLLEQVLDRVSEVVEGPENLSDGDVLQALTLAVAVRLKVAGVAPQTARRLVEDLTELALQGFEGGERVASAGTRH
jgi:predicted metalloenzyme YecM